jgi:hypothetical protein
MVSANNNPTQPQNRNISGRRKRSLTPVADTENLEQPKKRRTSSEPGQLYNPNHPAKSLYNKTKIDDLVLPYQINECLQVVAHTIKGRRVQTSKAITAGNLILTEDPMIKRLFRLPEETFQDRLYQAALALKFRHKRLFVQLSFYHDDFCRDQEWSRMKSNAMETTNEGEGEVWNLYKYISFINHS